MRLALGAGALALLGCGDGSNGPTVLNQVGVVRADIRPSCAGLSGMVEGVPLTLVLTLVSSGSCTPLAGRAL